jgi:peptide deformylase
MVIKKVLLLGNPLLRKKSEPVTNFGPDLQHILEDLTDTLTELQVRSGGGRGIAAPQIGYLKRIVRIQTPNFTSFLVNPEIVDKSEELFDVWDSCFSLKGALFVNIKRNRKVRVKYQDENGKKHTKEFYNGMSELLQHELDHLDGILCTDHIKDNTRMVMREEWEERFRINGIGM